MIRLEYLRTEEIARLERERAGGITSGEVVRLFESKGARLSASTFRKYVQMGLLPRSRRVGRKGKHTGSTGLYPVSVVRRIALIKRMMAEGYTVEDIRGSFVTVRNQLEDVEKGLTESRRAAVAEGAGTPAPQAVRGGALPRGARGAQRAGATREGGRRGRDGPGRSRRGVTIAGAGPAPGGG